MNAEPADRLRAMFTRDADDLRDSDIRDAIVDISHILNAGDWSGYDCLLRDAPAERMSIDMMIVLLRISCVAEEKLSEWRPFLMRCTAEVERRGRKPGSLFRGLYPKDDAQQVSP